MAVKITPIDYTERPVGPNFHYLVASVRANGITTPITVTAKPYRLIDGYMRVQVSKALGAHEITVEIVDGEVEKNVITKLQELQAKKV